MEKVSRGALEISTVTHSETKGTKEGVGLDLLEVEEAFERNALGNVAHGSVRLPHLRDGKYPRHNLPRRIRIQTTLNHTREGSKSDLELARNVDGGEDEAGTVAEHGGLGEEDGLAVLGVARGA